MSAVDTIFFVDDDPRAGELLLRFFRDTGYGCRVFREPTEALAAFQREGADLLITDLRMPGMSGTELLARVRDHDAEVPVIIITAYATVDGAIEALRLGATDFIKKPYDMEELLVLVERTLERARLRRENRMLRRQLREERLRYGMIGESPAMQEVYRAIDKVAEVRCSVVIQGESGTGKELAARAIHQQGPFVTKPFIVIDCGGLSDTLLESELFGHRRGAFTGADRERTGLLEAAGTGTVFLDEIGNISEGMQMKLLRVLEEGTVVPVGGTADIPIGARFIAATNRNLRTMVAERRFRSDLYHRLDVVTIEMPALADRREDIPTLLQHFLNEFAAKYKREPRSFSPRTIRALCARRWEGNVRELRNFVERCVIMGEGDTLDPAAECFERPPLTERRQTKSRELPERSGASEADAAPSAAQLSRLETEHIRKVLESVGGNQTQAAALLGINRTTLWRKLRQANH